MVTTIIVIIIDRRRTIVGLITPEAPTIRVGTIIVAMVRFTAELPTLVIVRPKDRLPQCKLFISTDNFSISRAPVKTDLATSVPMTLTSLDPSVIRVTTSLAVPLNRVPSNLLTAGLASIVSLLAVASS